VKANRSSGMTTAQQISLPPLPTEAVPARRASRLDVFRVIAIE
jgi:hypothetical protein